MGSPQAVVPSGMPVSPGTAHPWATGMPASAPAAPLPPPTLVFAGMLLTLFFTPLFPHVWRFLPFINYVFPEVPPAELTGSAVSCGRAVAEAAGTGWNRPCLPQRGPCSKTSALHGLPASLPHSGQHGVLYLQGISTVGDDWRSRRGPSKHPTGQSETTQRESPAPGTSSPQRTR